MSSMLQDEVVHGDVQGDPAGEPAIVDAGIDEAGTVVRSMPWMAIAVALHAVVLVIAVFIVTQPPVKAAMENLKADLTDLVIPPPPEPEQKKETIFPEQQQTEDPTKDPRIMERTIDERAETPDEIPLKSISPFPNPAQDDSESPNPKIGAVSNFGLGASGSGGRPRGGLGGNNPLGTRGTGNRPITGDHPEAGLQWLADHQSLDGYWSAQHYLDHSIRLKRGAKATHNVDFLENQPDTGWDSVDTGLTGLALLAFIGDAHTHSERGPYRDHVKRGVKWMLSVQDSEGCFGARIGDEYVYNHAICAMALAEIYAISGDPLLAHPAQRAVDFIVSAQNPGMGWRYGVKPGDNDSSVTAWMVLALKSARMAGLKFPEQHVYDGANAWYDKVSGKDEDGYIQTGYDRPDAGCSRLDAAGDTYDMTPSMDACCVMVRLFTHSKQAGDSTLNRQARRMLASPPAWEHGKLDFYYWYYASLGLYHLGDAHWKPWERDLFHPTLLKYQRGWHPKDVAAFGPAIAKCKSGAEDGRWKLDEHGSWDPVDAWGAAGGRVYATAINTLTLQAQSRYRRELESARK